MTNKTEVLIQLAETEAEARRFDSYATYNQLPLGEQLEAANILCQASADLKLAIEDWDYYLEVYDMPYHVTGMVG